MSVVIPYSEELANSNGCFITPQGEIIYTGYSCHEAVAQDICQGKNYELIDDLLWRYSRNELYYPSELEEFCKLFKVDSVENFDRYASSELSRDDLELYKNGLI